MNVPSSIRRFFHYADETKSLASPSRVAITRAVKSFCKLFKGAVAVKFGRRNQRAFCPRQCLLECEQKCATVAPDDKGAGTSAAIKNIVAVQKQLLNVYREIRR